jgi:hypothetical protein
LADEIGFAACLGRQNFGMAFGARPNVVAIVVLLVLAACTPSSRPDERAGTNSPVAVPTAKAVATPSPTGSGVLHWMSFAAAREPHYRLLYEGGQDIRFSELRLLREGLIVAKAAASPSADEPMRICGTRGSLASYGPLRVMLALNTPEELGAVIREPEKYRAEVLVGATWIPVALIHECDGQE